MGQGTSGRSADWGAGSVRIALLGGAAAIVVAVAVALVLAGVTSGEVAATVLFLPVFAAGFLGGRPAGYGAAVLATAAYVALRRADLADAGAPQAAALVVTRAVAYGVAAHAGHRARALVPATDGAAATRERPAAGQGRRPRPARATRQAPPRRREPVLAGVGATGGPRPVHSAGYGDDPTMTVMSNTWPPEHGREPWGEPSDAPGEPAWDDTWQAPAGPGQASPAPPAGGPSWQDWPPPRPPEGPPGPSGPGRGGDEHADEGSGGAPADPWAPGGPPPDGRPGAWAPPQEQAPDWQHDGWPPQEQQPYGEPGWGPEQEQGPGWQPGAWAPQEEQQPDGEPGWGHEDPAGAPPGAWAPYEQAPGQQGGWPGPEGYGPEGGGPADWAPPAPPGGPAGGWGAPDPGGWPPPAPGPGPVWDDPAANRAPAGDPWSSPDGTWSGTDTHAPAAGDGGGRASDLPAVDPETGLWTARFLRDRLSAERARSQRTGQQFSLVLVQVPDGPLAQLPYRRQVALLRELGYQFVAGGIVDHLVHVPDQTQHWFAVVLPDTDRAGAQVLERRLRLGIGGYLSSRGLPLRHLESASLTAPDDDPAMAQIWDALIGPDGDDGEPGW